MKREDRERYLKEYAEFKRRGIPFFPDAVFKDIVVGAGVIVTLIILSAVFGAPLEEQADPSDTEYTPRPEWYFLFLFQLLKYFPGDLEVVAVIVLPVIGIGFLLALPFLDRTPHRHWTYRPLVTSGLAVAGVAVVGLTAMSLLESPPPATATEVDGEITGAALFGQACAGCHGPGLRLAGDVDLEAIVAAGSHQGMAGWDPFTDEQAEILVSYLRQPSGPSIFRAACAECHDSGDLAGRPLEALQTAASAGPLDGVHDLLGADTWSTTLSAPDQRALLSYLAAPAGERIFSTYCSECHGSTVAFSGDPSELAASIRQGGQHEGMAPFQDRLPPEQLIELAWFLYSPSAVPDGEALYVENCVGCHGASIPSVPEASDVADIYGLMDASLPHQAMPAWGEVLSTEQISNLVEYIQASSTGTSSVRGRRLYAEQCASCHGEFGEGGVHPGNPNDIIAPISSAEFLSTRDDWTLRQIIARGQPDQGMSPFGQAYGGPLSTDDIDAIIGFLRSWEDNPPVAIPPPPATTVPVEASVTTAGETGETGGVSDTEGGPADAPTFTADIGPLLSLYCVSCHGTLGGWDGSTYSSAIESGNNGPAVVPGDPESSPLLARLLGQGGIMPPGGALSDSDIELVRAWIASGARE